MKLIFKILLVSVVEVWVYTFLYDTLGFSKLATLYLATTVLGAVMLSIRFPTYHAALNTTKKIYAKWQEKKQDPEFSPSADDGDKIKNMGFIFVYLFALALIVVPGIVTDTIGMALLIPAISNRYVERMGRVDLYKLMRFTESFDDHPDAQVNAGYFLWIRLGLILAICVSFIWFWGAEGGIAAVFVSITLVITVNQFRRFYCSFAIHPNGLHGYNKSKELLGQYNRFGTQCHTVMRGFWISKWAYFLYDKNMKRWSWRPYVLFCALAVIFYWSPLIGSAILLAFFSMVIKAAIDISVPIALYLGSSDPKSHELLKMLRLNSGIGWVSLLDDSVITDIPSDFEPQENDFTSAADLMTKTNVWSLRMNDTEEWMTVVVDFIRASAIIVVRPENEGAVRAELEVLANSEYQQRIVVIRTESFDEELLPERLKKCVLDEDEALALIAVINSYPRKFRERIRNRFNE